jgi:hypothetical protein
MDLGRIAPASEVAGGHTSAEIRFGTYHNILKLADHALSKRTLARLLKVISTLLLLFLLLFFLVDRYSWYLKYQLVFEVPIGI